MSSFADHVSENEEGDKLNDSMHLISNNMPRLEGLAGYMKPKKGRNSQQFSDVSS
jgi:hypothetical protein